MAILAGMLLAGCVGSDLHNRALEADNAVRVDPAPPGQPYDFVVSVRNLKDFGYDPDNKPDRDGVALRFLKTQCPAGRIYGETVIDTGTYLLGNPSRTYAMQVKCRG
jgi:hypothetical protein